MTDLTPEQIRTISEFANARLKHVHDVPEILQIKLAHGIINTIAILESTNDKKTKQPVRRIQVVLDVFI